MKITWLILAAWLLALLLVGDTLLPWQRLLISCVGTLWLIKACICQVKLPLLDQFLFRFVWPGMSSLAFTEKAAAHEKDVKPFVAGLVSLLSGIALLLLLAVLSPHLGDQVIGLIGLIPFFMIIHFGYAPILTSLMRLANYPVPSLFESPIHSTSLSDFWSRRWNRPFVEMNRAFFYKELSSKYDRTKAVALTFFISGLLHEMGISYPAAGGWGLPIIYFVLHGLFVVFEEKSASFAKWPLTLRRIWVWAALLLPLPLLFHAQFRDALIIPAYKNLGSVLISYSAQSYLETLLLLAGLGHFLVLGASLQVPSRLNWSEDLSKLTPFNRKIMWNYGFFILMIIISFGIETLWFRHEMVAGVPAALGMALLIAGFWTLRVLVDCFYYSHEDWPKGAQFVVGHALINALFIFLILVYWTLLGWHLWKPN